MKAKAVRVKEYRIVGDSTAGEGFIIRVFFGKGLIDCFQGKTEAETLVQFTRAGYRMIEETSEQKESQDDRGGQDAAGEVASRSREKGTPRCSSI